MLGVFFSDFVTAYILQGVIVVGLIGASNLTRWFVLLSFFWSETSDFFCNFLSPLIMPQILTMPALCCIYLFIIIIFYKLIFDIFNINIVASGKVWLSEYRVTKISMITNLFAYHTGLRNVIP